MIVIVPKFMSIEDYGVRLYIPVRGNRGSGEAETANPEPGNHTLVN